MVYARYLKIGIYPVEGSQVKPCVFSLGVWMNMNQISASFEDGLFLSRLAVFTSNEAYNMLSFY